jgi:hypothetical protein
VQRSLQSARQARIMRAMTPFQRALHRLSQRTLQAYELLLCALLVALAAEVVLASTRAGAAGAALQCGNIQSSAVVIAR